jgi:hypothetical protein
LHRSYYNKVFASIAGVDNVGWIAKDIGGCIVKADGSGRFARMVGLTQRELIGSVTANLPWSNLAQEVEVVDDLVRQGEVRESVAVYWHPLDNQWRRVVSAKWLLGETTPDAKGSELIYCMMMDVSGLRYRRGDIADLSKYIRVDWERSCAFIGKHRLSRAHGVCLSYYLDHITQPEIAKVTDVTLKTVERRIAHLKEALLPLDKSCENLYVLCRKYGIRSMLEEKRDWFDRLAVIWPITNGQWQ